MPTGDYLWMGASIDEFPEPPTQSSLLREVLAELQDVDGKLDWIASRIAKEGPKHKLEFQLAIIPKLLYYKYERPLGREK